MQGTDDRPVSSQRDSALAARRFHDVPALVVAMDRAISILYA
jgi:hypothetical protein